MPIKRIFEERWIIDDLKKYDILKQYQKCKNLLLSDNPLSVDFKKRKPKKDGIYQFRITKKYRAICYVVNEELSVVKIDKHQ